MEVFTRVKPHNEMFAENLTLRSWVNDDFPNSLVDKMDENLFTTANTNIIDGQMHNQEMECVSLIMEVALNCTKES